MTLFTTILPIQTQHAKRSRGARWGEATDRNDPDQPDHDDVTTRHWRSRQLRSLSVSPIGQPCPITIRR